MRSFILFVTLIVSTPVIMAQSASAPNVIRHENFKSDLIDPRHVDVWLPPGYHSDSNEIYPVIYMHDGQNLFNPKDSFIGVVWSPDSAVIRLIQEKQVRPAIIVGIWNNGEKRFSEYMPEKAANLVKQKWYEFGFKTTVLSDNYLKFIVFELKPFIDKTYRTQPDKPNTFVMGSSMGGLISLYAVSEYPEIFGGAGCISTHWPAGNGVMLDYMKGKLPSVADHKLYFDFGTETLDSQYEPFQMAADDIMTKKGWIKDQNWMTLKFQGDEHSERAWKKRVHIPIEFLLGQKTETK